MYVCVCIYVSVKIPMFWNLSFYSKIHHHFCFLRACATFAISPFFYGYTPMSVMMPIYRKIKRGKEEIYSLLSFALKT